MRSEYSTETHREPAKSVPFWWHSIDLGQGFVTDGMKTREFLRVELDSLRLPALKGRTVLDIGAWDGYYSFEAERRGAARVVALDYFSWSLELADQIAYWRDCKERGVPPLPYEETPYWKPATLPGKRGFDTAREALGSRVEAVVGDFMTMDLQTLGTFDVVLFLGVLYHLENPLEALKRLASVAREVAIIETHAVRVPDYEHLEICEFYSASQLNGDSSNWWGPNLSALTGMCTAAGFSRVEIVSPRAERVSSVGALYRRARRGAGQILRGLSLLPQGRAHHFRAVAHAWK